MLVVVPLNLINSINEILEFKVLDAGFKLTVDSYRLRRILQEAKRLKEKEDIYIYYFD